MNLDVELINKLKEQKILPIINSINFKEDLSKLNFIVGIILIIPFAFIGSIVEDLARLLFGIIQNIAFALDFMGVMGGWAAMFWEKLITEAVGSFVFCAVTLCGPIFLNKKFFPKFKINWIPAIILAFIYFDL